MQDAFLRSLRAAEAVGVRAILVHAIDDKACAFYRRFGFLHARVLLHKQDELRELEEKLEEMDKQDENTPIGQRSLKSRDRDDKRAPEEENKPTRKQILAEIEKKLNEYCKNNAFPLPCAV